MKLNARQQAQSTWKQTYQSQELKDLIVVIALKYSMLKINYFDPKICRRLILRKAANRGSR